MIVLVAVLLALNGVLTLMVRADVPPIPEDGALLYATTFDDDPEVADDDYLNQQWTLAQGQDSITIDGGVMFINIGSAGGVFAPLNMAFSDFRAELLTSWVSGDAEVIRAAETALLFRYQNTSNFYAFKLRGDGAYRVERVQDGVLEVLSEWQIAPSALSGVGGDNRLTVIAQGSDLRFLINDQPLRMCPKGSDRRSTWNGLRSGECVSNGGSTTESLTDETFRWGQLALGAVAGLGASNFRIAFDNVILTAP
ncbi:MAG: hypothetical protein OHK0023_01090 [Anaerolineae bacterium]